MTLRTAKFMAEGRLETEWQQTSMLCATIVNVFAAKGRKAKAEDFNPFAKGARRGMDMSDPNVAKIVEQHYVKEGAPTYIYDPKLKKMRIATPEELARLEAA